jgi:tetratricopeptide (TPR) repeat protein
MAKKSRQRKVQGKQPPETRTEKINTSASVTNGSWWIAAVCAALVLVTAISYRGVRNNEFVSLDDNDYVVQNRDVQQGVNAQSIEWAFTAFHSANWHPLTWISHMIDWKLYGNHAGGHHITNLCLHCANAVLLFLLLLYMTGFIWRSSVVAFLFALHPAHVESVAWISERKDVLSTFFWFAALLAYAWYVRSPSWKRYALIVCAFACGLMSKPMVVTFPFTLLLFDYWPLRRISFAWESRAQWISSQWKLFVEKWPLFLMTILSSIITFFAQRAGGTVATLERLPLLGRLSNAAISYCRYLLLIFWPNPLTAYYYYASHYISVLATVLSVIAILLITVVCWRFRKDRPYCLIGWLWFLGTLTPVIGIIQVGEQSMAERYTYVPSIGILFAVVWLIGDAVANSPKLRAAALLLAVAVIAACAVKTDAQVKVWKDTTALFTNVLEVDPRGELPNLSLGIAYMNHGKFAEAQEYYDRALNYKPSTFLALSYSAFCQMISCEPNEPRNLPLAKQRLDEALLLNPQSPDVLTNLALWSSMMGKPNDEEAYCRKALAANPFFTGARLYLSDALQAQGKLDEALEQNRLVLAAEPDTTDALNNIGGLLDRKGLSGDAVKAFQQSLAVKPGQAMPHSKIGRIYMGEHHFSSAAEEFAQALRFNPSDPNAHDDLGVALYQMGDFEKAAEQFGEAVRINPADAGARRNFDIAQSQMKAKKVSPAENEAR